MSDLCKDNVAALSKLCRIKLTEEELTAISRDLKKILDYAEQLQEVDVSDLPTYTHVEEQNLSSLREDRVGQQLSRDVFLNNAPDQVGGMVRVPPVIKQGL